MAPEDPNANQIEFNNTINSLRELPLVHAILQYTICKILVS